MAYKSYKGTYRPNNTAKYLGDPSNIIYRSSWELKFMKYCDSNDNVLRWGSEELAIPYISPADWKKHRYFPDFFIEVKKTNGTITKYLVEVKPKYQTQEPKTQTRVTKRYVTEVVTYAVNKAKWKAAEEFCLDRSWEFMILTEHELKV